MTTAPAFSLASRLKAGETVYSGWCGLPAPIVAEVVGREGFPAVTLDAQHGLWDIATLVAGIAQVRQAGAAAIYAPDLICAIARSISSSMVRRI